MEEKEKPQPIEIEPVMIIIPECCKLGLPNCPHVPKKKKKAKTNIGL